MKYIILVIAVLSAAIVNMARGGEIGRYDDEVVDIRNYFVPVDRISSEMVDAFSGPVNVNVGPRVRSYALMPMLVWAAPYEILGTRYTAYVAPFFANNNVAAELSIVSGTGGNWNSSSFAVSDLYMQRLCLDLGMNHLGISLAYDFYAPVSKYSTQTVPLPNSTDAATVASKNNIRLRYSTLQAQAGIAWYPMTNKTTAVTAVGTYEYNGETSDFDIRPGQMFTITWGVSHYLPLNKNQELLLEVGPAGYDSYQITDSTGGNAFGDTPKSRIDAVGGQLGLTYVPWNAFLAVHGFYEYAAASRFPGASIGLYFGIKF